jgi:hypothetical protein
MTKFTVQGAVPGGKGGGALNLMTTAATDWQAMSKTAVSAHGDALKLLRRTNGHIYNKKLSSDVLRYANRYFLTDRKLIEARDLVIMKLIITKIWNGLSGDITLKIGDLGAGTLGEVNSKIGKPDVKAYHNQMMYADSGVVERSGAIRLSDEAMNGGSLGVLTLIHEASHKYAGTMDYCYFKSDGLTPESTFTDKNYALVNADSYAWFVVKVGRSRFSSFSNKMYT